MLLNVCNNVHPTRDTISYDKHVPRQRVRVRTIIDTIRYPMRSMCQGKRQKGESEGSDEGSGKG